MGVRLRLAQTNHRLTCDVGVFSARPLRAPSIVSTSARVAKRCSGQALNTATHMPPAISDQNQFLSELSATELAVLRPHLVDFDITAGDCLHHIGDPIERVVFPHSGVIGMTSPLRDTAGAVVARVGREGIVGGLLATASMPSSCNAEVRIGGRASLISAAAFRYALDHHPGIASLSRPLRRCNDGASATERRLQCCP